jgi:transcriptional regulator with XRE-family HTH domain
MTGLTLHQVASAARGRRQSLGLSQSQVANSLGVSRRWMRDFEAGDGGAHFETVLRLLDLLGIGLAFTDDRSIAPDEDEGILDSIIDEHRSPS